MLIIRQLKIIFIYFVFRFGNTKYNITFVKQLTTKKMKTYINDFKFTYVSYGHYRVTYTSPKTGKQWSTVTSNMPLIDACKNREQAKRIDLNILKYTCKNY